MKGKFLISALFLHMGAFAQVVEDENLLAPQEIDPSLLNPGPDEVPADVKDLEERFNRALNPGGFPNAANSTPENEMETLSEDEKFERIPLRPKISDLGWKKWAGNNISKKYKIKASDSLWKVSEDLFGTPYLWPKVWQLNANLTNPHDIQKNYELSFRTGNPNDSMILAPVLARNTAKEDLPSFESMRDMSELEKIEKKILEQTQSDYPPFRHFLLDKTPKVMAKIPDMEAGEHLLLSEGDIFPLDLVNGTYSIIREGLNSKEGGSRIHLVGILEVIAKVATIKKAYSEIHYEDLIVEKNFALSPLAVYEHTLDQEDSAKMSVVPVQEGYNFINSEMQTIGLKLKTNSDLRAGALIGTVDQYGKKLSSILILDRDKEFATAWILNSRREYLNSDRFQ